jgi:hypothetical protein
MLRDHPENAMKYYLYVLLMTLSAIGAAVGGLWIVRRKVGHIRLSQHNDVAGFVYAVIGVVYAVILGFVVVVSWELFRVADEKVEIEVRHMSDLFRGAGFFTEPFCTEVRKEIIRYVDFVVIDEWPLLADCKESPKAYESANRVVNLIRGYRPRGGRETICYAEMIAAMNKFINARSRRIHESRSDIPTYLWLVLLIGAAITIGYSFLFGTGNFWAHSFMSGSLTFVITLVLMLIYAFDHPFSGIIKVDPDEFIEQKVRFEQQLNERNTMR